jgi:hypothetical protein
VITTAPATSGAAPADCEIPAGEDLACADPAGADSAGEDLDCGGAALLPWLFSAAFRALAFGRATFPLDCSKDSRLGCFGIGVDKRLLDWLRQICHRICAAPNLIFAQREVAYREAITRAHYAGRRWFAILPTSTPTAVSPAHSSNTFVIEDLRLESGRNPFDNRTLVYNGTANDALLNQRVHRYAADPEAYRFLANWCSPSGNLHRELPEASRSKLVLIGVAAL